MMDTKQENAVLHQLVTDLIALADDYKKHHAFNYLQRLGTLKGGYEKLKMAAAADKLETLNNSQP